MPILENDKRVELKRKAVEIRMSVIESLMEAGSGHTAGSLGMADIFTVLYFYMLRHKPEDPFWEDRDRVILSNGHICPVLYATLAHSGYFPMEELNTLRVMGSRLQGHPHREYLPGVETSSGPLGCGLSQTVGMALAERMDKGEKSDKTFYCLLSDGEMNSGNTWEGGMLGAKEGLGNIIAIMDRNNIQIDGHTNDVMPLEPLCEKWESWGWYVIETDGHNIDAIIDAINEAKTAYGKPVMVIADTVPGKGVPDIENKYEWHGKALDQEMGERAIAELRVQLESLQ
ncbi:MAG: transketolase [Candidatus Paceibacterota bacterium]